MIISTKFLSFLFVTLGSSCLLLVDAQSNEIASWKKIFSFPETIAAQSAVSSLANSTDDDAKTDDAAAADDDAGDDSVPDPDDDDATGELTDDKTEPAAGTLMDTAIADLLFDNGMRAVFTYDETNRAYGLDQNGPIDTSVPLIGVDEEPASMLQVFLDITPDDVPVPEMLTFEDQDSGDAFVRMSKREISRDTVVVKNLKSKELSEEDRLATHKDCAYTYISHYDYHYNGYKGMKPKCHRSKEFGGKTKYVSSFLANCTKKGAPSKYYAKHKFFFYYKGKSYDYYTAKLKPGYWHAVHKKFDEKLDHKVCYSDGWKSSKNCGKYDCLYTKEGKFY